MKKQKYLFLNGILIALLLITGCVHSKQANRGEERGKSIGSSGQNREEMGTQGPKDLISQAVLGPSDVIDIQVFKEKDLSGVYRINNDGTIIFPLIGSIDVDGKTANMVATDLQEGLKTYLKKPYVSVFVKEFNSKKVYVFGQVKRPGTFKFEERMNVVQAITLAGGFSERAARDSTSVTRIVEGKETRITVKVDEIGHGRAPNFFLEPGDIVYIPEGFF